MATRTQDDILSFLIAHSEERFTIRGIAKQLHKSYTLVYNNIADLEKEKIIVKHSIPPAQIITLNDFAPTDILVNIELKRKNAFLKKHPWAEVMLEDIFLDSDNLFFIMLVFGSYAKGKQTPKSDMDILVIVQDKKDINRIEHIIHKTYTKVKKGVHFAELSDFKEMIKNTNEFNVGNEARKHHIILHGAEAYCQLLKNIYKK